MALNMQGLMPQQQFPISQIPQQQQPGFGSQLRNFLFGQPEEFQSIPRFTPEQQQALQGLLPMATEGLQQSYDFGPIEQRARGQFARETVPTLAERFTALGQSAPSLSSPAFAGQLGQAASQLEEGLGAQRAQFGLQQGSQLQNLLGMGLQPQFETALRPRTPGVLEQTLPSLLKLGLGFF